jgi:hypothetical protein
MYVMFKSERKNLVIAIFGIIIVVSVTLVYYTYPPLSTTDISYGDVTVEQTKSLIESKPSLIILDVRTQEEYDSNHIEGAILIPDFELEDRLDELSKGDELLVYC